MNSHQLSGTVDTEVQMFQAGDKKKYTFRLAAFGNQGWHNVVVWEGDAPIPKQGDLIYLEGRKMDRSYEGTDGNKRYITETIARVVVPLAAPSGQQPPAESDLFE